MCLYVNKSRNIRKPLTVYVVREIMGKRNTIRSPYNFLTIWTVGKNKVIANEKECTSEIPTIVGAGYFHSFSSIGGAKKLYRYLNRGYCHSDYNFAIYEAEILPSKIYIGEFKYVYGIKGISSIASTNITLIKKIGE